MRADQDPRLLSGGGALNPCAGDGFDVSALANAATRALRAYDPGHDLPVLRQRFGADLIELGANENPLGPSPRVLDAIRVALAEVHLYPDPKGGALKAALAAQLAVDVAQIALGNGSHELLMLLAQCFADAATSVVFSEYGFAVFPIATTAAGAHPIRVPALPREHATLPRGHDLDAMAAAIRPDTRIVYLANPNNPTGTWFDDAALDAFIARAPPTTLVVIDEAYAEYIVAPALTTALRLLPRHPNVVVTRTFSKAHGLAGLRVGYAVSSPSVIAVIERLRESFNVNALALAAANAALSDADHVARSRAWNHAEREWLVARLRERGLRVSPSQTNFVLVDFGQDAAPTERALYERGVIVRPVAGYGLHDCLRISVGTRAANQRLLDALP
ncbi:MAG: histidinol-phosphate transaminase [Proteobacteria bacterium]|nr:histidinol-phosphate transaminase [Pseudomonadota bacterium]